MSYELYKKIKNINNVCIYEQKVLSLRRILNITNYETTIVA